MNVDACRALPADMLFIVMSIRLPSSKSTHIADGHLSAGFT